MILKYEVTGYKLAKAFSTAFATFDVSFQLNVEIVAEGLSGYGTVLLPHDPLKRSVVISEFERAVPQYREIIARFGAQDSRLLLEELLLINKHDLSVQAAFDLAIFDLMAKRFGVSLSQLFGVKRDGTKESGYSLSAPTSEAELLAQLNDKVLRYPILKLKMSSGSDLSWVKVLRDHYQGRIWVDANGSWSLEQTKWAVQHFPNWGVEILEQPLPAGRLEDLSQLERDSRMLLIADEDCTDFDSINRVGTIVDGIAIKVHKCGGIGPAFKMALEAKARGLLVMLGCRTENCIGISAMAQLAGMADFLDLDGAVDVLNDSFEGSHFSDGKLVLREGPGLGITEVKKDITDKTDKADKTVSNRIIYLGGGRDIVETLAKGKAAGAEIHYIQKADALNPEVKDFVEKIYLWDYEDEATIFDRVRELCESLDCCQVFTLNESALLMAARLRERLGLPGNSLRTVELFKDKSRMRSFLNEKNLSPVAYRVGHSMNDVEEFHRQHGPMIVKPLDACGSFSVFVIAKKEEIDAVCGLLVRNGLNAFLMEEYLAGPEYSVESFSSGDGHQILAVTEKFLYPDHFVERGHLVPARVPPVLKEEIELFVQEFLSAVGMVQGPAHTEVKVTPKGLRVIESQDRTGGDRINELVRLTTGIDMKRQAFEQLIGGRTAASAALTEGSPAASAAIWYTDSREGLIHEVLGVESAKAYAGVREVTVLARQDQKLSVIRESQDRPAFVLATGATADAALQCAQEASQRIQFQLHL